MMLKTILVSLTTKEQAATLMKLAVPLARRHNAHLLGLHTLEALLVYPSIAMHIPEPAFADFTASQRDEAAQIKAIFQHHTKNEDFPSEWRLISLWISHDAGGCSPTVTISEGIPALGGWALSTLVGCVCLAGLWRLRARRR